MFILYVLYLYISQPIGICGFRGLNNNNTLYLLVGIVLIVTQNLFDMDDLRAGVPCDPTTH